MRYESTVKKIPKSKQKPERLKFNISCYSEETATKHRSAKSSYINSNMIKRNYISVYLSISKLERVFILEVLHFWLKRNTR